MLAVDPALIRDALERATEAFAEAVHRVPSDHWDRNSGCGTWTVRQLVAHTMRALTLVPAYLDATPTTDALLADALEYYRVALSDATVHQAIGQRAAVDAQALADPAAEIDIVAPQVLARVAASGDDEPVNTRFGQIALIDYLPTRVVELGLHTVDLQRAIGAPVEMPDAVAEVCLEVLARLGPTTSIVLALAGRGRLDDGFNVLG